MSDPKSPDHRAEARYELCLPVVISSRVDGLGQLLAVSRNISVHGILLRTQSPLPQDAPLTLRVALQSGAARDVYLTASGKVVRFAKHSAEGYIIAVRCDERPFRVSMSRAAALDG